MRLLILFLLVTLPVLAEDKREICTRHFERSKMGAQLVACTSNLKNIATATEMYATDHGGQLPTSIQQLTPEYLRTLPTNPASGKGYDYKLVDATHYLITTQGDSFKPMGVPPGYPRYEGASTMGDIDKMTMAQKKALLAKMAAEDRNPPQQPVYWKPGQLVPRRANNRDNDLRVQADAELLSATVSGDYSKALALYKKALQVGGLYPWEQADLRQLLKEMGER